MRLKSAVVLWAMHPWERDARLAKEALSKGPQSYGVLIEVVCTRSTDERLGARRAYHSLYEQSIEEDVAYNVKGHTEGKVRRPKVHDGVAKSEATLLRDSAASVKAIEDEEVVRILSTRSKPHLKTIYDSLDQDIGSDQSLKDTLDCLCSPHAYFSSVLDVALKHEADEASKEALTPVIVTRADVDIKEIGEAYKNKYGVLLAEKIS